MSVFRRSVLIVIMSLAGYIPGIYCANLSDQFDVYLNSIAKILADRECQERKWTQFLLSQVDDLSSRYEKQSDDFEADIFRNNERYQNKIKDMHKSRKHPEKKETRVCGFILDLFEDSPEEDNVENFQDFDELTELLRKKDTIRMRQDALSHRKKKISHLGHDLKKLKEKKAGLRQEYLRQLKTDLSNFHQVILEQRINEIQYIVQIKRKNKIRSLRQMYPTAYKQYLTLVKKMTTILDTYMILATGKIALATDKTSQAAQLLGSAIKNIPGTHSLGSGVQAGIVAGKNILRNRRIQAVYRSFESRESVTELSEWVCLKIILQNPVEWGNLEPKKAEKKADKTIREIYHLISDGTVLKYQKQLELSDVSSEDSDVLEDLADFLVREYQLRIQAKKSIFRRSLL